MADHEPLSDGSVRALTVDDTRDQSLWRAATFAPADGPLLTLSGLDAADDAPLADAGHRYRIREVIGEGGMGEVRRCQDEIIGREVAVKTLRGDEQRRARLRRRFLREVRIQGQLEHPSIVPVYDLGTDADGELFFTMRRLQGRTLAELIAALARGDAATRGAFTRRKLLAAFVSVCLAVDYAHTRGVLHRDLKPANVIIGDFGEVYVLDWGVAQVIADAEVRVPLGDEKLDGGVVGTPGYMAPEQLRGGSGQHDRRTDVYALGATLYELLAWRPLHPDRSLALTRAALDEVDARPGKVVADVAPELDEACVRATAVEPADRYASARELAAAVERYLEGESDLLRRRELATENVDEGRRAAERARGRTISGPDAEASRTSAMRSVMRALALDAEQREARELLVELVTEVPDRMPPAVEQEMADAAVKTRLAVVRFCVLAMAAWVVTIPFIALLGVRDFYAFGLASTLCVVSGLSALWIWRRQRATSLQLVGLAVLVAATCSALACWLGPFVLVPTVSASATAWFAFLAQKRQRLLYSAIGALAVLVPLGLELGGFVAPSFTFDGDTLVLHARALHLPPVGSTVALIYSSVSFSLLQPLLLGLIRDALTDAERKLFLQSWRLRQLAQSR